MSALHEKISTMDSARLDMTIDDFPSASRNDDPMLYPGIRPESSFLLDGEQVRNIVVESEDSTLKFFLTDETGSQTPLDKYLLSQNVAPMSERIAILGYGNNMCPASIHSKFTKVGRSDVLIVPTIYAQLTGYDVVWSGGPGVNGNFIANLYTGPETTSTTVEVGVNFLTREQLLVMHSTELSYDLTEITVLVNNIEIPVLVYAGIDQISQDSTGAPISLAATKAKGRNLKSANARQMLEDMLAQSDITTALEEADAIQSGETADTYVASSKKLINTPGAKLARKQTVHETLSRLNRSRLYKLPVDPTAMRSWANPSTIATFSERQQGVSHHSMYNLPHQEIPKGSWGDETKRELALRSISTHHMRMTNLDRVISRES